jgi:hypothetical protein
MNESVVIVITDEQVAFFEDFGFLFMKGFVKESIDETSEAFEEVWQANGEGPGTMGDAGRAWSRSSIGTSG